MRRTLPFPCLAALLAVAFASSCTLLDMDALSITSWSPLEEQLAGMSCVSVWIQFSRPVSTILTEQAFSITADGAALGGRVSWLDDSTLVFTPYEPLEDSVVYEMRVSKQAEDLQGRDLRPEFSHTFTTKSDYTRPSVVSASPADHASITDLLSPLSVAFSKPMEAASLYPAFSLSPSVTGIFSLSADSTTLTFTPTQRFQWQTRYTLTIGESASDAQRNTLGTDFVSHFFVGTDTTPPLIASLESDDRALALVADDPADSAITITSGWESNQGLVVSFSELVLTASAISAIALSPASRYEIQESNDEYAWTLSFTFPDRLAYGETYTVSVASGIQDSQGNKSTSQAAYYFEVNGPLTQPPVVTHVYFPSTPGDSSTNVELHPYDSIALPPVATDTDTFFDIYVDLSQGATLDPFATAESFSVTTTNNAATISSFAIEPNAADADPPPDAGANEVVHRVWVRVRNNATSGQVVLHISVNLEDSRGTPLQRELVMPLNDTN